MYKETSDLNPLKLHAERMHSHIKSFTQEGDKLHKIVGHDYFEIYTTLNSVIQVDASNVYDEPPRNEPNLLNVAEYFSNLQMVKPDYFDSKVFFNGKGLTIRYTANGYFGEPTIGKINVVRFGADRIEFHINMDNHDVGGTGLRNTNVEGNNVRIKWDYGSPIYSDLASDYVQYSINPNECWQEHEGVTSAGHLVELIRDMFVRYVTLRRYQHELRVLNTETPCRYITVNWDLDEDDHSDLVENAVNLPSVVKLLDDENYVTDADEIVDRLSEEYGYCIYGLSAFI
jgi:hypothetical protein